MSDRFNDVLAAIDAETAKCICGRAIPTDGPSLDYCSYECQYRYAAGLNPVTEPAHNVLRSTTNGRTINAEVNAWFRASSNDHPDMGWGSAAVTIHGEPDRPVSPRVEFFPSPRPGEPIDLAAGIDLTPYLTCVEVVAFPTAACAEVMEESPIEVGDIISFTGPDGTTTRSIVTHANENGSFDCEPAPSDTRSIQ